MSDAPVKRDACGHLLPGSRLNPGGRPRGVIEDVRERLGPHTPEFVAALVELARSPNETIIREAFDRLLGKPPVAVDSTVAKFDMGALYLEALKIANQPPVDVTPAADAPAGADCNSTAQW